MKVWLRTFGCRANQYDTEAVREMVERDGHAIVADASEADVAVFNSCAVTADAVADLRQAVRRAARENPDIRTVVMGCASALAEGETLRTLPNVSNVVGGADLDSVARALGFEAPVDLVRTRAQSGTRGLLRVQDGCDEHCTFCATTMARGANRSRSIEALVAEATGLADRHPEIVITGIHVGTYGHDVGSTLGGLMTRLVESVPDVRFRLTSIEATEVDECLLDLMASEPRRLVPQIHAPLQSGSNAVLKRMGRHWYTAESYRASIETMAERLPVFGLGADVIAGFPGETEADHEATMSLVDSLPFTYLHVFPYSARPGTAATRLGNPVAPAVSQRRAKDLRHLGSVKTAAYLASRVGQSADVVVVGGGETRHGLTEDYLDVDLVGSDLGRGARAEIILELREGRLCGVAPAVARPAENIARLSRPDATFRLWRARVQPST
jgi:threonylcarbamoyladenosine tRNA methylthiotransferase MtaB